MAHAAPLAVSHPGIEFAGVHRRRTCAPASVTLPRRERPGMDMGHRHLADPTSVSLMALDDILDRGSPGDWSDLVRLLQSEPHGPVSEKVLYLCNVHYMYGTSKLWPAIVQRLRRDAAS